MTEQFRIHDYEEPIRDMAKVALGDLYTAIRGDGLCGSVTGWSVATERTPRLGLTSAATTIYRAPVVEEIDSQLFNNSEPPVYLRHMVSLLCDELTGYLNNRHNSRGQAELYPPHEQALQRHLSAEWFSLHYTDCVVGDYDVQLYHTNAFYPIGLHLVRRSGNETWNIEYGYKMGMVLPHALAAEMPGEVTIA